VNGSTSPDRTNYYETFSANDENLRWALGLEADRMVNSYVSKADLDQEMTVVRNEFERGENEPFRVLSQRTMSAAFLWHNYGKSTIGAKSDLENVPVERLREFYRKYYQPDNAVLVVAGNLDEAKTIAMVAETAGKLPRPARQLERTYTLDPDQDGERTITVRRVGDLQAVQVLYRTPDGAHADLPAIDVLADILSATPSGRLHKALVETKMAASVNGGARMTNEPGVMSFTATLRKEGDLKAARETLIRVVQDIVKEPPTKDEVDRVRNASLSQLERGLTDSDRLGLALSETIARGDWRLVFRFREDLKKVTPEDVVRVAKAYLKEDNRTVGMFIPVDKPDRAIIPPVTDRALALKDFRLDTAVTEGETFDATPENIEKRLIRASLPVGMKLQLLPKKTRGNTVTALISLRFGDVENTRGLRTVGSMAGSMLSRGTAKHTRQQFREEFDKLRARVQVNGGPNSAVVSIETTRDNLAATLRLAAEELTSATFPSSEYEQLKQSMLAMAERRRSEPASLVSIALSRHLNPWPVEDIRYTPTVEEEMAEIKAVTLEQIQKFHKAFYGASNGSLTVVGDHDPAQVQALAVQLFGNWKSPSKYARLTSGYHEVKPVNESIETPDKANANFSAGTLIPVGDEHRDYPAFTIANFIFGGGMSSRLFQTVRTKEGLSYSVRSGYVPSSKQDWAEFEISAISAPQNTPRVEAVVKAEIEKARTAGFTETELAEARNGYLQNRAVQRSQDASLAGMLSMQERFDRTMIWQAEVDRKIGALTLEQVNAAFRKYVDASKLSYVKGGDFSKK